MNKAPKIKTRFVVCVRNDDYAASLEVRKLYVAIADKSASAANLVRLIDESDEDYLYPASHFAPITLPIQVRRALRVGAKRARWPRARGDAVAPG